MLLLALSVSYDDFRFYKDLVNSPVISGFRKIAIGSRKPKVNNLLGQRAVYLNG